METLEALEKRASQAPNRYDGTKTWEEIGQPAPYPGCPNPNWTRPLVTTAGQNIPADAYFDQEAADKAVQYFTLLKHHKGRWYGQPFVLEPWQEHEVVRPLFGWMRADGRRLYSECYLEVPRKNGKSTMSAGLAGKLAFADKEPGAEVYSAAADRDQAAIVFDGLKEMMAPSPGIFPPKRFEVFKRSIVDRKWGRTYKVLSADVGTKHGLNAHGVVVDELHVQPNRDLVDVLATSMGSRTQPMFVSITTAGVGQENICFEKHDLTVRAADLEDETVEPFFLGIIYACPKEADWTDPAMWAMANPNLGVSVSIEFLAQECDRAKNVPAYQNTFRRLYLNQWTAQRDRWLDMTWWDKGKRAIQVLERDKCYGGLDLASTTDLAAFLKVVPKPYSGPRGEFHVVSDFWLPTDALQERERRDRVPYQHWIDEGLIHGTHGNVIDYDHITQTLKHSRDTYDLQEIGFDRWGATKLVQTMQEMGLKVVPIGQGYASMSAPMKDLITIVMDCQIVHGGNPVLRWMADNVTVEMDPAGNIKPNKRKSTGRIDGIVALIMALDRAMREYQGSSVYDDDDEFDLDSMFG